MEAIHIKGAREHNLKNLDLTIPRNQLVVITGLSGSGKSSLAFDTLYAEGQRRYVESLSAYARQFLDQMEKPDVDSIEGLSPAISIEQKTTSRNPRSTVATVTEIYDYLRLLYARTGKPVCLDCGQPIASQTIQEMADQILTRPEGTRIQILAPVVRARKGEYKRMLQDLMKRGYIRARVNGEMLDLTEGLPDLDKQKKHTIEVVIDRLKVGEGHQHAPGGQPGDRLQPGGGLRPGGFRREREAVLLEAGLQQRRAAAASAWACRTWSPAPSPSTRPSGPAPPATAWASSGSSPRSWWCPTPSSPSARAPSRPRAGRAWARTAGAAR